MQSCIKTRPNYIEKIANFTINGDVDLFDHQRALILLDKYFTQHKKLTLNKYSPISISTSLFRKSYLDLSTKHVLHC